MECHSKSKNILPAASAAIDDVLFSGDGRRRRRRNDFAFGLCLL